MEENGNITDSDNSDNSNISDNDSDISDNLRSLIPLDVFYIRLEDNLKCFSFQWIRQFVSY